MHFNNLKVTIVVILFSASAKAAVIRTTDCSVTQVQNAINSSQINDVVELPGGNCSWSAPVTIGSGKAVTLNGGGATISGMINLNSHASAVTRITNFKFTSANAVGVDGTKSSGSYRIDHNTFTVTVGGSVLLEMRGNGRGLVDHNSFNAPTNSEMIHNMGMGPTDTSGWTDDVTPGSADAVYIEDNTFTNNGVSGNPAYFWGNSCIQSYYGARTVFRYNKMNMSQVDQHGTPGMIGARWWEIYENTFYIVQYGNQDKYIGVRAGTGVIFNNHKSGFQNEGGGSVVLVEEDSGYPALYQIGRGKNQTLEPAYVWGNDSTMPVRSGSSNVQANRDFYLSAKPGYIPYTYPHPLAVDSVKSPNLLSTPTKLRVVAQ